jgi:excisionase family DNA binding protein
MSLDDAIRDTVKKAVASELDDLRQAIASLKASIQANAPAAAAPHDYVDAAEAAAIAGVKAQTVRRWIARGELRGHRAGRLLRVRVDELRAFLAAAPPPGPGEPDDELLARRLFRK